jgi:protein-tyrosine phosphatase
MHLVAQNMPGHLWIMPCPDTARLSEDIEAYHSAGITHVVSMQPQDEAAQLGLTQQKPLCVAAGIRFHRHPIVDFGLPEIGAFTALIRQISGWIDQGDSVAVHCRAGIGRSGMAVAGVLIARGQSVGDAVYNVSNARGVSIPDTVEQATFLDTFAKSLLSGN